MRYTNAALVLILLHIQFLDIYVLWTELLILYLLNIIPLWNLHLTSYKDNFLHVGGATAISISHSWWASTAAPQIVFVKPSILPGKLILIWQFYCLCHKRKLICLNWTIYRYFRALAKGEVPPVKDRLEMPSATQKTDTGLTAGLLRVLNKQVIWIPMLL